ncbi:MAG TPA: hypothetical protein VEG24_07105 [Gaiellaceae bacterium]|nr:hypothetical protein [Gaiellaceae bacterium]
MSGLRLALAGLLVAAAVLVALLAADVRSWPAALESGDAVYAATPGRASWTPSTRLGGLAEGLLGVGDDVAQRRALQLYSVTIGLHQRLDNALDVQTARARAQDALASAARDSDPQRAAQARTLLGILTFGSSASGGSQSQVDAAVSDFTDAIRADPEDDFAKFDLELLLRLTAAHGTRTGPGQSNGLGATGRHGAGGGVPGNGY